MGSFGVTAEAFGINDRQWALINEYLIDFNGTRAAIRAGYPEKSARKQASMDLNKPNVKQALQALLDQRSQEWGLEHGRILQEMQSIAYANMKQFVRWDEDGINFVPSPEIDDARAGGIVSLTKITDKNGTQRMQLKFGSKEQMLMALAKISGLMRDKPPEENRGAFARWSEEQKAAELNNSPCPGDDREEIESGGPEE
jgi:phage terminase small subunit